MSLRFFILAAAIAGAHPAFALSCLVPDPVEAFAQANAAPETYVVVLGSFSGGPGPRPGGTVDGTPRAYEARFAGHLMSRHGPVEPFDRTVKVAEQCAGSWCAEMTTGEEVLTFLRIDPGGIPVLEVGPCYDNFFVNPTPEQHEAVRSCFVSGCTAS